MLEVDAERIFFNQILNLCVISRIVEKKSKHFKLIKIRTFSFGQINRGLLKNTRAREEAMSCNYRQCRGLGIVA